MAKRLPNNPDKLDQKIALLEKQIKYASLESQVSGIKATYGAQAYEGSSTRKSWAKNWNVAYGTPDETGLTERRLLSDRSADLYRNNAVVGSAIDTTALSVIGKGLYPQSNIRYQNLGLTFEQADKYQEQFEYDFEVWANSVFSDFYQRFSFWDNQYTAFLNYMIKSEFLAMFPIMNVQGEDWFTVQLLDCDRLGRGFDYINNTYRDGVVLDELGRVTGYKIQKDESVWLDTAELVEIPKYGDSGRVNIIHVYDQTFIGQSRGIPKAARGMENSKQTDRSIKNSLVDQVVSSMMTGFITSNRQNALYDPFQQQAAEYAEKSRSFDPLDYRMEPGLIYQLNENEKLEMLTATKNYSQFKDFIETMVNFQAISYNLPPELVMKKVTSNFSAHKAVRNEAWRYFFRERAKFNLQFNDVVYREWFKFKVAIGEYDLKGFVKNSKMRESWMGVKWQGEGPGQIEPVRETNAAIMKIKNNLSDYEQETAKMGEDDWETIMKRKHRQIEKLKSMGLYEQPTLFDDSQDGEDSDEDGNKKPGDDE